MQRFCSFHLYKNYCSNHNLKKLSTTKLQNVLGWHVMCKVLLCLVLHHLNHIFESESLIGNNAHACAHCTGILLLCAMTCLLLTISSL